MMKNILFSLVALLVISPSNQATAKIAPGDANLLSYTKNYLRNGSGGNGLSGVAASGGTLSSATAAGGTNGDTGVLAWDSSAADQTLTFSQISDASSDLPGSTAVARFMVRCVGASTCTHKLQLYDSSLTSVINETTITSSSSYFRDVEVRGTFTSSTTVRFISVASNEPSLELKFGRLERARSVVGLAGSDWQSYTPTWTSEGGSPSIGNGTLVGLWRRVGDTGEYQILLTSGSTTTGGTGNWYFSLPSGQAIDMSKLADTSITTHVNIAGSKGAFLDAGNATWPIWANVDPAQTGRVQASYATTSGAFTDFLGTAQPATLANGDVLRLSFEVPIAGWSAGVTMASDPNLLITSKGLAFTAVAGTPAALGQYHAYYDSNGATSGWNFATDCTVGSTLDGLVNGTNNAYLTLYGDSLQDATHPARLDFYIGKNLKRVSVYGFSDTSLATRVNIDGVVYSSSEKYGTQRTYDPSTGILSIGLEGAGSSYTSNNAWLNRAGGSGGPTLYFYFEASNSDATVGIDSPVHVSATTNTATSISSSGAVIVYEDEDEDNYSAYNASSGIFTAPRSGLYRVSAGIMVGATGRSTGDRLNLYLRKNGSTYRLLGVDIAEAGSTVRMSANGTVTLRLNAGDTLSIFAANTSTSSLTSGEPEAQYLSITEQVL